MLTKNHRAAQASHVNTDSNRLRLAGKAYAVLVGLALILVACPAGWAAGIADGKNTALGAPVRLTAVTGRKPLDAASEEHVLRSPTLGSKAPTRAIQLFDGTTTEHFASAQLTPEGHLAAGATTLRTFQDFRLHVEFRVPHRPDATGQDRGNSGVYLQKRYEVQILDSYGMAAEIDGCGAIYRQRMPSVNACLPPLAWQTYDIEFTAARFDEEGRKTSNARITVVHNGVVIHNDVELLSKTGAGQPEGAHALPILFQDHGNPVVFRNIWILERHDAPDSESLASQGF